jgi:hypothetical protein
MPRWEYLLVPLADARRLKKSADLTSSRLNELGQQGREAVGASLGGDLVAWPFALPKRAIDA